MLATSGLVMGYVALYVWFLVIAGPHGKTGNMLLSVLMVCGIFLLYRLDRMVSVSSQIRDQRGMHKALMATFIALSAHAVWYGLGALMPHQNEQHFFAYGPAVLLVFFMIGLFIRETATLKDH